MSLQIYDKTTGSLTVVAASATRTWIGSKAAHDAEALANKLPNNCLLAVLETGLYYRDSAGTETLVTAGGDSDVQAITMPTADAAHLGKVVQYIGTTNANYTHNYWYECVSDGATPPTYTWQRTDVQPGGSSIQVNALPTAGITELGKVYQYIGADTQDYKHGYFYECTFDGTDYAWTYLDVDEGDGNQIQFDTLPSPTVDYEGRIVQYTGVTNANYTNAYFYKCVSDGQVPATYTWEQVNVQDGGGQTIQVVTLPTAAIDELGKIYQYTGVTTQDYTHGYFYECIFNDPNYEWVEIGVSDGDTIQFSTMPTASADLTGKVYQYIGETNQSYTHNYFYECVSDGEVPPTYSWKQTNVQPDSEIATTEKVGVVKPDGKSIFIKSDGTIYTNIWIGTKAKYDEEKYKIPYDTIIYIIDDGGLTPGEDLIVNGVKIVSWAEGTDAEIAAMVAGADQGKINLTDYWSIGDERIVHLSAIAANPNGAFINAMDEQDVVLVLMNEGYNNQAGINFVVGQKDCLNQTVIMDRSNSYYGSWRDTDLRADLNSRYYNALPPNFKSILKPFNTVTGESVPATGYVLQTVQDYISVFAEKEIFGNEQYHGYEIEHEALSQIIYYTNINNRIKYINQNGTTSASKYWQRSPVYVTWGDGYDGAVSVNGTNVYNWIASNCGVAPFMCI